MLIEYGDYLTGKDEYKFSEKDRRFRLLNYPPEEHAPVAYIRDYQTPCAVGYAVPIEGDNYIDVPRDASVPREADFSVHVVGDSMEPYIKDGQRVFVKRDCPLQDFDVGIFFYNGDVFIRQYYPSDDGNVNLLSANPKREHANILIPKRELQYLVCLGKVLLPVELPVPNYRKHK